jgi:hypothetical protein
MENLTRRRSTLEYHRGTVWLTSAGLKVAAVSKGRGIVEQMLANSDKAGKLGQLRRLGSEQLRVEWMENNRFRTRVTGSVTYGETPRSTSRG